jgi:hypothetical protein
MDTGWVSCEKALRHPSRALGARASAGAPVKPRSLGVVKSAVAAGPTDTEALRAPCPVPTPSATSEPAAETMIIPANIPRRRAASACHADAEAPTLLVESPSILGAPAVRTSFSIVALMPSLPSPHGKTSPR